jgi:hypothetical protein
MRFRIKTLVDVTETNARKGQDPLSSDQQANFNTLYNTIGLRSNPTEFVITVEKVDLKNLGFGNNYKGKHNVWTVEFYVEAEESTNIEFMNSDFDLIPIITGLTETAELDKGLFVTLSNHGRTNILFERIDK